MLSPPPSELAHAVGKIKRVPNRHRTFSDTLDVARQLYRIDAGLLELALELGLPSRGSGAELRVDPLDLKNLVFSLRLPIPWFQTMRWWGSALKNARANPSRTYRIGLRSQCRRCVHPEDFTSRASPELVGAADAVEYSSDLRADLYLTVRLAGSPAVLPPDIVELMRPTDAAEWHVLPNSLATDVGFLRETGLGDCRTIAHYVHQEGRRRGMRTRTAFGLFVAVPYSFTHSWAEFDVDGRWLAADPLLLNSLARWGFLDPVEWPSSTSTTGSVWRVNDVHVPLATHDGVFVDCTLATARLPTASQAVAG